MKRVLLLVLGTIFGLALFAGIAPQSTRADEEIDVTAYTYEITPLLDPFPYYLYVKTDNPDPESFRLVDPSSVYYGPEDQGEIYLYSSNTAAMLTYCDPGTYYQTTKTFYDVTYENKAIGRVKGGYIFEIRAAYSDGGELTLLQRTRKGSNILNHQYQPTSVTVACPALVTSTDYLIRQYADASKTLFENLAAVQNGLNTLAVYPQSLVYSDQLNEATPYPYLASSIYPEHPLMSNNSMYIQYPEWLLAFEAYPFILSSYSFPLTMWAVANQLEPNATVAWNTSYHHLIDVTYGGVIQSFGGAGEGDGNPLLTNHVEKRFTFQGDAGDLSAHATNQQYRTLLLAYDAAAAEDAAFWLDLVEGATYRETIRQTTGTWLRLHASRDLPIFGYVIPLGTSVDTASETWVDGRYIDIHERYVSGESFRDHPTADIIVHNVSYTDRYGHPHQQDVRYRYDSGTDTWRAGYYYSDAFWCYSTEELPRELYLTRAEAEAFVTAEISAHGNHFPAEGLVYDGTEYPGTPFHTAVATGVILPEEYEVVYGDWDACLPVTMVPTGACPIMTWESSDPDVATCEYQEYYHDNHLNCKKVGTTILTGTTVDGNYTATCKLIVVSNVTFLEQPRSQTVAIGGQAVFRVKITVRTISLDQVRYDWQYRANENDRWRYIYSDGYNTDTLTVSAEDSLNGCQFRCYISGVSGVNAYSETATLTVIEPPTPTLYGDVNGDGKVNAADAALVLRSVVRLSSLDLQGAANADVDGDGSVTANDALLILRYSIGLVDALPVR